MVKTQIRRIGDMGEEVASKFLSNRGYEVIARNYQKPWGELDLIAKKDGVIIFVEVKTNSCANTYFQPEIRGDWKKMQKVARTAKTYLAQNNFSSEQDWQIDLISVVFIKDRGVAKIKHFKNIEI